MSRPEHLNCVNTAEGIHRINEDQAYYDEDPERYEREERQQHEREQEERQREYEDQQYGKQQEEEEQQEENPLLF